MPIDNLAKDFLTRLNSAVKKKVTVVLIGGNALVFLDMKEGTTDVDIVCRSTEPEVAKFCREYLGKYKVKSECFIDGLFKGIRIKDYLKNAYSLDQEEFPNIDLKILNLYDIILMKIDRSLPRDLEDISKAARQGKISRDELDKRFKTLLESTMRSHKEHFAEQYKKFMQQLGSTLQP